MCPSVGEGQIGFVLDVRQNLAKPFQSYWKAKGIHFDVCPACRAAVLTATHKNLDLKCFFLSWVFSPCPRPVGFSINPQECALKWAAQSPCLLGILIAHIS